MLRGSRMGPATPGSALDVYGLQILRVTNFLVYVVLISIVILDRTGRLSSKTPKEISDEFLTPLTPDGTAFYIWTFIFTLHGLGTLYQVAPFVPSGTDFVPMITAIGYLWQVGWAFEVLWMLLFALDTWWVQVPCLFTLLAGTAAMHKAMMQLDAVRFEMRRMGRAGTPFHLYLMYVLPTSVNAAWMTVATALGILVLAIALGATFDALTIPSALLAGAVSGVGLFRLYYYKDIAYSGALIWSLAWIGVTETVPLAVRICGFVCLSLMVLATIWAAIVKTHAALTGIRTTAMGYRTVATQEPAEDEHVRTGDLADSTGVGLNQPD